MDGPDAGSGPARDRRWAWAAGVAVAVALAIVLVVALGSGGEHRAIPATKPAPGPQATKPAPGAQATKPAPGAQAAKPAPGAEQFGVSVNRLFNDGTYSPAQIDSQLAAVQATEDTNKHSATLREEREKTAPTRSKKKYERN